ncbi:MAG: hypothetical protein Q9226_008178 [Calogaya cf. arnoldii]
MPSTVPTPRKFLFCDDFSGWPPANWSSAIYYCPLLASDNSLRISTFRSRLQAARQALSRQQHPEAELTQLLRSAESVLEKLMNIGPQTVFLGPTFTTYAMIQYVDAYDQEEKEEATELLRAMSECFILQSLYVECTMKKILEFEKVLELITSLISYTVPPPSPKYFKLSQNRILPEYARFQSHQTALEGLSTLLKQQTTTLSGQNAPPGDRDANGVTNGSHAVGPSTRPKPISSVSPKREYAGSLGSLEPGEIHSNQEPAINSNQSGMKVEKGNDEPREAAGIPVDEADEPQAPKTPQSRADDSKQTTVQALHPSRLEWSKSMVSLNGKLSQWCQEMQWLDAAVGRSVRESIGGVKPMMD